MDRSDIPTYCCHIANAINVKKRLIVIVERSFDYSLNVLRWRVTRMITIDFFS
jgi:hypothetical protein